MTNGDGDRVFLDTNVLVYANAAEAPLHHVALRAIETRYDARVELWISRQVLREYLATFSRPQRFLNPRPIATVVERVRFFQSRFRVAEDSPHVTERLLALMQQIAIGGKQVHDANIVATMQAYGIRHLLTHNTDDFIGFSHLITVLPLEGGAS
jgi:predicted nucleic acid-binding protein